ncbi:MAG: hypothetical protein GDA56_17895 [Hormoscilla sp. GM7CHS1pb]|nr:hypothetical protein [Hormoscilla sp. GM7CHS1pb]
MRKTQLSDLMLSNSYQETEATYWKFMLVDDDDRAIVRTVALGGRHRVNPFHLYSQPRSNIHYRNFWLLLSQLTRDS